jgi:hypothetical protein
MEFLSSSMMVAAHKFSDVLLHSLYKTAYVGVVCHVLDSDVSQPAVERLVQVGEAGMGSQLECWGMMRKEVINHRNGFFWCYPIAEVPCKA